jgi:hypothetical protein
MMGSVASDFDFDDESPEEIRRSLRSGTPVLVIPSHWRRDLRGRLGRLLKNLSDDLGRAAERVGTAGTAQARASHGPGTSTRSSQAAPE